MRWTILCFALFSGGCVQSPPLAASPSCPILESSDWQAWINAMPGPNATPTLIVTGRAVVPSGGYDVGWGPPIVMESYPVQVSVELQPVRSPGMHTQALVTKEVRGEWPMRDPVGAVSVTCGPRTVARISPVVSAR